MSISIGCDVKYHAVWYHSENADLAGHGEILAVNTNDVPHSCEKRSRRGKKYSWYDSNSAQD